MGGKTPNASHVRKITFRGCPPCSVGSIFSMWSIGYETRVFSVIVPSSKLTTPFSSVITFSSKAPGFIALKISGSFKGSNFIVFA